MSSTPDSKPDCSSGWGDVEAAKRDRRPCSWADAQFARLRAGACCWAAGLLGNRALRSSPHTCRRLTKN
ncbi:hypothetical protein EYC57_19930 [Xanthomonas oryzae]|nr:hypothetical protein EYC57_19930 [Xanthomonas oryzae]